MGHQIILASLSNINDKVTKRRKKILKNLEVQNYSCDKTFKTRKKEEKTKNAHLDGIPYNFDLEVMKQKNSI